MELFPMIFNLLPEYFLMRLKFPYLVEISTIWNSVGAFLQFITLERYCGITSKLNLHTKNWKVLKGNFIDMNINALYTNTNICLTSICAGSYWILTSEEVRHLFFSLKLALILWPIKAPNKPDTISVKKFLLDFHKILRVLYNMSWGQRYASRNSDSLTVLTN
jgi:hypothetical protein